MTRLSPVSVKIGKMIDAYKRSFRKRLPTLKEIEGNILAERAHWEFRQEKRLKRQRLKARWQEIFGRKAVITDGQNLSN